MKNRLSRTSIIVAAFMLTVISVSSFCVYLSNGKYANFELIIAIIALAGAASAVVSLVKK
jgi:hypothetical protein